MLNSDDCTKSSLYVSGISILSVVCLCVCVHVCIYWQGAEGSRFQHQQADESLGPNSLEAELALILLHSLFGLLFLI